ncbi:MAG: hypothetical protein R6U45_03550 [Thioalkalivibrio sp.]|uniref:hypothetical protein n=1 Tax=Thioalkalivibrio sp. TaxID=2093813 RepID=UPI0039769621
MMRTLMGTALVLLGAPALAHPGHGHSGGLSLLHLVSSPEHIWPLALGVLVIGVAAGAWLYRRRSQR